MVPVRLLLKVNEASSRSITHSSNQQRMETIRRRRIAWSLAFAIVLSFFTGILVAKPTDMTQSADVDEENEVMFDEGTVYFDEDIDSVSWWRVETVEELKEAITQNAANVSIERDITMDMPMFDTPIRREMTVRGDVGEWCRQQREGSCMIGSKNGQIFLVHPAFGLLHLKNMILQDGYRDGEAFFIEGATLGPEPTLVEMYEEELRKYAEAEEEYATEM